MSDRIEDKLDDLLRRAQVEVADVDLFAPPPPNEECPICFLPYLRDEGYTIFLSCCGKMICGGCAWKRLSLLGSCEAIEGHVCAFCREPPTRRWDNHIKAVEKHMQKQNPRAFVEMAIAYQNGNGVPQNECRALEMFAQAANLGDSEAYYWIAKYYNDGFVVEKDTTKCRAFLEVAAKKGLAVVHHTLAGFDIARGEVGSAIRHHKVAACAGLQSSLTELVKAFKEDLLPKEDLEHCLRAFQASDGEMKSKDREDYLAYRKSKDREAYLADYLAYRNNQL